MCVNRNEMKKSYLCRIMGLCTNCEQACAGVCVSEREKTARKMLLCLSGAHVCLFCCAPCVCVSDSTPRSYLHGSRIVFITVAMIHRTANEKQQAGPDQASPPLTSALDMLDVSGWAHSVLLCHVVLEQEETILCVCVPQNNSSIPA